LKIVVCVKPVPDTAAAPKIDAATKRLVRLGGETVLNPFDEFALEAALRLRDTFPEHHITVLALAPAEAKEALRKTFALGVDSVVHVCDTRFVGSDGLATARILASALHKIEFDLVLCGTQSADGAGGYMPTLLAGLLDIPAMTSVRALTAEGELCKGERNVDGTLTRLSCDAPLLVSISKEAAPPRYASLKNIMAAKKKETTVLTGADLELVASDSVTEVLNSSAAPQKQAGRIVENESPEQAARTILAFLNERHLV
jgi:electron transfer flavoprotein beta subunit